MCISDNSRVKNLSSAYRPLPDHPHENKLRTPNMKWKGLVHWIDCLKLPVLTNHIRQPICIPKIYLTSMSTIILLIRFNEHEKMEKDPRIFRAFLYVDFFNPNYNARNK